MMKRLQPTGRRTLMAMAVLGLAVTITACHHGDDDHDPGQGTPPVGATPTPPTATDAFVSYVTQLIGIQDETGEPASIDGVAATAPEGTEPLPVSGS
jgi:hypothetical protein